MWKFDASDVLNGSRFTGPAIDLIAKNLKLYQFEEDDRNLKVLLFGHNTTFVPVFSPNDGRGPIVTDVLRDLANAVNCSNDWKLPSVTVENLPIRSDPTFRPSFVRCVANRRAFHRRMDSKRHPTRADLKSRLIVYVCFGHKECNDAFERLNK